MLDIPYARLTKTHNPVISMSMKLFHKLPINAHYIAKNRFKSIVYNWLIERPFYYFNDFISTLLSILSFKLF